MDNAACHFLQFLSTFLKPLTMHCFDLSFPALMICITWAACRAALQREKFLVEKSCGVGINSTSGKVLEEGCVCLHVHHYVSK